MTFFQKLSEISRSEWNNVSLNQIPEVVQESLLYGMKITTSPSNLKRSLKKYNLGSKKAREFWTYDSYLSYEIPKAIAGRPSKANPQDVQFVLSILSDEQIQSVKDRIEQIPEIDREDMLKYLTPVICSAVNQSKFLGVYDRAIERGHAKKGSFPLDDLHQDVICEALRISYDTKNWPGHTLTKTDVYHYISPSVKRKSKTHLDREAKKIPIRSVPEHLRNSQQNEDGELATNSAFENAVADSTSTDAVDLLFDLKCVLPPKEYIFVSLTLGEADEVLSREFSEFCRLNKTRGFMENLENFTGLTLNQMKKNTALKDFLKAKAKS